jgi:hypothetical protein
MCCALVTLFRILSRGDGWRDDMLAIDFILLPLLLGDVTDAVSLETALPRVAVVWGDFVPQPFTPLGTGEQDLA